MRSDSIRHLLAAHGPAQGRVHCDRPGGEDLMQRFGAFVRADGVRLVEAILGRAGLLDVPGWWTIQPNAVAAGDDADPVVLVREATTTSVRLVLQPGPARTALDLHLLVYRDKGDPREVRKKLKDAVAAVRAAPPAAAPAAVVVPAAPVAPPPVVPAAPPTAPVASMKRLTPPPPVRTGSSGADAYCNEPAALRTLIDAVDAAQRAPTLSAFVRSVGLEFTPDPVHLVWSARLAALARAGMLAARREGDDLKGYTVAPAGRQRLVELNAELSAAGK